MPKAAHILTHKGGPTVLGRHQQRASQTQQLAFFDVGSLKYRGCWHQTCPPVDTRKEVYKSLEEKNQDMDAPYCQVLSKPDCVRTGELVRSCLPGKW